MVGYYNRNGDFVNLVETSADKISFDDSVAQVNANNVQNAIENLQTKLQTNFQAGVDAIYDAVVAEGSTPASHALNDVVTGIHNIPNKNSEEYDALTREDRKDLGINNRVRYVTTTHVPNYNSGTSPTAITANGTKDIGQTNSYRYFTVNVPNTNTETFLATTRESAKDMGVNNNYRWVNTTGVPNINNETFPATTREAAKDMGEFNKYRWVNTNGVPNYNSGTSPTQFVTNGTKDIGVTAAYRYYVVNVPASAVVSGTYTYPVGSTGGTTDITNYKEVNAENVYAKGKADGHAEVDYIMLGGTGWDWNEGYVELNYTCAKKGVLMCFFPPMPYFNSTITKNGVEIPQEGVPCDAGLNVGDHYQLYCMGRQRAGEGQIPFRITSVSAGDQLYIKFNSKDGWQMTAIFAFIVYTE